MFVAMLLLQACPRGGNHSTLEDDVFVAVAEAWEGGGLQGPYGDGTRHVEDFQIDTTKKTTAAYEASCPKRLYDGVLVGSWACLRWRYAAPSVRTILYPVAVISPLLAENRHAAVAAHELCHAMSLVAYGDDDSGHLRLEVWRPRAGAVETVAVEALYPQGVEDLASWLVDGVAFARPRL